MGTDNRTDRERFEAGETIIVWGEQCHGMAGRRAHDADRIFDEDGDITPDFEQFDATVDEINWLRRGNGSSAFATRVRMVLRDELVSRGLIDD